MQLLTISGRGVSIRDALELVCLDPFFFERNLVELDQAQYYCQSPPTSPVVRPESIGHNGHLAAQPVPNDKAHGIGVFSRLFLLKHNRNLATPVRTDTYRHLGHN